MQQHQRLPSINEIFRSSPLGEQTTVPSPPPMPTWGQRFQGFHDVPGYQPQPGYQGYQVPIYAAAPRAPPPFNFNEFSRTVRQEGPDSMLAQASVGELAEIRQNCIFAINSIDLYQWQQRQPPQAITPEMVNAHTPVNPNTPIDPHTPINPHTPIQEIHTPIQEMHPVQVRRSSDCGRVNKPRPKRHRHTQSDTMASSANKHIKETLAHADDQLSKGETISCRVEPIKLAKDNSNQNFAPHGVLQQDLSIDKKTCCMQCGARSTPEWRRGPHNAKTLCNACGLFHNKLVRKFGIEKAANLMLKRRAHGKPTNRTIY